MSLTQVTTRGIAKGVEVVLSSGLTGDPSLAWAGDEDTGLYSSAAGYTDFTSNGITVLSIGPTGLNFPAGVTTPIQFNGTDIVTFDADGLTIANGKQLILPQGSPTNPSIGYSGDTNTGMYSSGDGQIDFVSNGQVKLSINATGLVLPTGSTGSSINITNNTRTLYVSGDDTLATDSIDNTGRSLNKPFKTIERALLEAAVQSWQNGPGDELGEYGADLFEYFTIVVFPGTYYVDNRPGDGSNASILTEGAYSDETLAQNMYRFNSVDGGVIIPRGTSIVGLDLRKTTIRPKFVPSPVDASAKGTAIFRVTGGTYLWQMTFKDCDLTAPYKSVSATYTNTGSDIFPCSHHKVSVIEYASYPDLDAYYTKIDKYSPIDDVAVQSNRHADASNLLLANKRFIAEVAVSRMLANFPSFSVPGGRVNCEDDVEDVIETIAYNVAYGGNNQVWDAANLYATGGVLQHLVGEETESIYTFNQARNIANEVINNVTVTVNTGDTNLTQVKDLTISADPATGSNTSPSSCANVQSAITTLMAIVTDAIANPSSLSSVVRTSPPTAPSSEDYIQRVEENRIVGPVSAATLIDTVASCSPYIFNCSVRSVFGMNGLLADGSRATGFKSMVLAQYTGISLQKDDRAFVGTNLSLGTNQTNAAGSRYHVASDSVYRDDWRHFHIKATNDSFLQVVSVFAVGNADHFLAETGGDMSITNSNSNFGNTALKAVSHRPEAFPQDSGGYIIGVVPPRGLDPSNDNLVSVSEIDVGQTVAAYNATANNLKQNFKKIYLKINGSSEIKEGDIPEFYIKNSAGTITKAELLVDGLNYSLGKRIHSDGQPEAIYANLSKTPADPSNELYGARLRARDGSNTIDPTVTYALSGGGTYTTKNDVRSYYAWEYTQTNGSGEHLGRVCLLVNDSRAAASATITGIPTGFTISANGSNQYPDKTAGTYTVRAELSDPATPTTQSTPIDVIVTINGSGVITAVDPASNGGTAGTPGTLSGSGFSVNNKLTLPDGTGTGLGTRIGSAPIVINVSSVGTLSNVSYTADNIKPDGYLPNSAVGARYRPIDTTASLESQSSDRLSLLRRLTQKIDSNADGQTSLVDDFEFTSNTAATAQIKRIQDNRQASGSGELLWRAIYKLPNTGTTKRKPPESRFTIQLRDPAAVYPFTYNGTNTGSKSFYIYNVETLIEYKFGTGGRDGYYLLTLLDGNVITKSDGSSFTNTIKYGVQTTSGSGYTVTDTVVTGWGVSQNINYLYPEIDLDNPKWNPKTAISRYRDDVGNTIALDTNLSADGYDRITQYSITAEATKNFLNNVLAGGTISGSLSNELNLSTYFGISSLTDAKMEDPYSNSSNNVNGINEGVVTEFVSDVPQFSGRCILFGNNVTSSVTGGVPVNLHRPSILRASGHTWEYVGFGPGNYSTAFPRFQTETLNAQQQVNAQGIESGGGFIASSGTNSQGDFFIGNQVIDTKGNQSNTLNFPRVKTSADNKLIDFGDPASLSSNSASSSFNPSSFSATLTQSLASLQQAQQNSFKTANLEATTGTIGSLKVNTKLDISSNVFTNTSNFPAASPGIYGFAKRAVDNWYQIATTSTQFEELKNSYISPHDLYDWANKNAFITTVPITWPLLSTDIPAAATYNAVSNAGEVLDTQSLQKTSNFSFQPYDPTDARWYNSATAVTAAVLGGVDNLVDYEGRSGQILLIYDNNVNLGAIHPTATWKPVTDTFRGVDPVTGNPVNFLTSQYFLVTYYVTNGKIVYAVNAVNLA